MSAQMTTDFNKTDPYAAPLESGVSVDPDRRCFPWRIILVVLLYIYGGLLVFDSAAALFMLFSGCCVFVDHHRHLASDAQINVIMLGTILFGIHGCLAIAAGRYAWKQCWTRSIIVVAGAIVLAILTYMTSCIVDRLPPGMQWPPPSNKGVATAPKS
jgi:hypothetical protein